MFYVIDRFNLIDKNRINDFYLLKDNWNDWFRFCTLYRLYYIKYNADIFCIGDVKIGQFNMDKDQARPELPNSFTNLGENYFSVGQDENYYVHLRGIAERDRNTVLDVLNDFAYKDDVFKRAKEEDVTKVSLLRSISETTILGQFRRILTGGAKLSKFGFSFCSPMLHNEESSIYNLDFRIDPDSKQPSNLHVLIGRNGVGKTTLLANMAKAILLNSEKNNYGNYNNQNNNNMENAFSALITVSFSAFDNFFIEQEEIVNSVSRYSYVGLKKNKNENKSMEELDEEFWKSLINCFFVTKLDFWKRIIAILQYDPIFDESDILNQLEDINRQDIKNIVMRIYKRFSSGHKIVLFILTKLIEQIEEKTLVLIDEPESHLHPPLLSAYIRALSELLKYKNAVCIVATHSPIVLQEVTSNCVWILQRNGLIASSARPSIESFGESTGILTREVFGLELTKTGFYTILKDIVNEGLSYDNTITDINDKISYSAKILLSNMIHQRDHNV